MYARVLTARVKPGKLDEMARLYQDLVVPFAEQQPGFKGLFMLTSLDKDKEVSVSLWETEAEMAAFGRECFARVVDQFSVLLAAPPDVEIYKVRLPAEVSQAPHHMRLSESSLGVRLVEPFDKNLELPQARRVELEAN
jgi:heme-degrading monooxygenase HmoA